MELTNLHKAFAEFQEKVISAAKSNLNKKKYTGKLEESIKGNVEVHPNSVRINFKMEGYGWMQDQGVKGIKGGKSLDNFTYKKSSNLVGLNKATGVFSKYVKSRRIQFRNKKGQFLSYEQSGYALANTIKNYGIKPSLWFTKPFESALKTLPDTLIEKYGLDAEKLLEQIIDEELNR